MLIHQDCIIYNMHKAKMDLIASSLLLFPRNGGKFLPSLGLGSSASCMEYPDHSTKLPIYPSNISLSPMFSGNCSIHLYSSPTSQSHSTCNLIHLVPICLAILEVSYHKDTRSKRHYQLGKTYLSCIRSIFVSSELLLPS